MTSTGGPDHAEGALEVRVLGEFAVLRAGKDVGLPPSRKTRALLAYLAVVGRPQHRDHLCGMFWDTPDDPRGALRWSLSKIRQIVNSEGSEALVTDRNMVALPSTSIALDLRRIKAMPDPASLAVTELEHAAGVLNGGFLEDLSLPRCPAFEAWRLSQINEVDLIRARILRTLVDKLAGEPSRALPHAHALKAMLPDDAALAATVNALAAGAREQAGAAQPLGETGATTSAPSPPAPPAAASPDRPAPIDIRFFSTADGVRIAYSVMGDGPPIVQAASAMSHLQLDWESPIRRHWIAALAAQHRLLRYDGRGSGLSDWHADDLSFAAMVADLESIVDAAKLDRFALLGMSEGCAISIAYAAKHPERVAQLVLHGGCAQGWRARGDPDEIARRTAMGTLLRQGWGQDNPAVRQMFTALAIPAATHEQQDWYNELQHKAVSPKNASRLYDLFADIDVSALMGQVTTATLVLHARGDQSVPHACGRAIAEGIAGARLITLESDNHILLAHEPAFARFLDEVRSFIAAHQPRSSPAPASDLDAERRHATVLAIEIVSPLHAFGSVDPELVLRQIDPLFEATFRIIERNGGIVSASRDTGITAVFGTLPASEQHALAACRAALLVKSTIEAQSEGSVRVRAGLDSGEVIVRTRRVGGSAGIEVTGVAVRTATRLAHALRRGALAATDRTRLAAGGAIDMTRMSRADFPRFDRDEQAYEIVQGRSE
jgi:pimeloyl-ACP methyl ester carboxylesterase/DNA-binding SARP family transcriptional activator/class 3 adenylate cyclase